MNPPAAIAAVVVPNPQGCGAGCCSYESKGGRGERGDGRGCDSSRFRAGKGVQTGDQL